MTSPPVDPAAAPSTPRTTARRIGGVVLSVAVVVGVVLLVRATMPSPREMIDAVRDARMPWVVGAVALQVFSVLMLAGQQRRILGVLGTPVGASRMAAITLASTAVSLTMPAGGAVGAGWAFRQYRLLGATRAAASTVTVVSGLAGAVGLAALVGLMWSTHQIVVTLTDGTLGPVVTSLVLVVQAAIFVGLWTLWSRRRRSRPVRTASTRELAPVGVRRERVRTEVRAAVGMVRELGRDAWRDATVASVGNRLLDAACLWACCVALRADVDFIALALVYLGIQLVRQIPLTPGGVGVVEVALLAGLTSIGVAVAIAAGIVVLYRLIAAWLLVPVGYAALLMLRRRRAA